MASRASLANWLGSRRRVDVALFLVALAPRLLWVGYVEARGGQLFGPDAATYDTHALNLLAGKGLQMEAYGGLFTDAESLTVRSYRPPLLPILLAGVYGLFGHHFWAARVVLALLGAAVCVVVCWCARRVFDERAGLLAGVLAALYPKLVYYSASVVTETPCTLLLALSVWALLSAHEASGPGWRWLLGGVFLGLGALTRSSLLAFAPVAALWVVLAQREWRRRLLGAALFAAAFVATMSPWWVRNWRLHGRFVPATSEGGYTFWQTNNPRATGGGHCYLPDPVGGFDGLDETGVDREFYRRGMAYVRGNPGGFLRLAGSKFVRFWRLWPHASEPGVGLGAAIVGGASFIPVLCFAVWGAIAARARWRPLLLFYMMFLTYTVLHMVYMAITRYRLPMTPYLLILAAWGLLRVAEWIRPASTAPALGLRAPRRPPEPQ